MVQQRYGGVLKLSLRTKQRHAGEFYLLCCVTSCFVHGMWTLHVRQASKAWTLMKSAATRAAADVRRIYATQYVQVDPILCTQLSRRVDHLTLVPASKGAG